jgi:hypothetical protein
MKKLLLLFVLINILFSCNKKINNVENLSAKMLAYQGDSSLIEEYSSFFLDEDLNHKGAIQITHSKRYWAVGLPDDLTIEGDFYNLNTNKHETYNGPIFIGNLNVGCDNDNQDLCAYFYRENFDPSSNIFGHNTRFLNSGTTIPNFDTTFYIPHKLVMAPMGLAEGILDTLEYFYFLDSPKVFSWNPDPNATKGVMIKVSTVPDKKYVNGKSFYETDQSKITFVSNYYFTQDNGSCILPSSVFDNIPNHYFVNITIMRGNFVRYPASPLYNYDFVAYSSVSYDFILKRV